MSNFTFQIILYQTEDGQTRLEVRLDNEYLKKPDQPFDYLNKLRWCIRDGRRTGLLVMQPDAIGGKILQ